MITFFRLLVDKDEVVLFPNLRIAVRPGSRILNVIDPEDADFLEEEGELPPDEGPIRAYIFTLEWLWWATSLVMIKHL